MPDLRFVWYDVFTDRRFAGNPLAVFPEADGLSDADMAAIARELNLSETTFVLRPESDATTHRVRIFTPTRELGFAGHPTVGTAVALADLAGRADAEFVLGLGAGPTPVSVTTDANGGRQAAFRAPTPPACHPSPIDARTAAALIGLSPSDLDERIPLHVVDAGGTAFLVCALTSLAALARSRPAGTADGVVGVYVVAPDATRWRCRMFAPAAGVPEDPATGSAAVAFAATLHAHVVGFAADGTHLVDVVQGVEMGRPSRLALAFDVVGATIAEVRLAGSAVRVLDGIVPVP